MVFFRHLLVPIKFDLKFFQLSLELLVEVLEITALIGTIERTEENTQQRGFDNFNIIYFFDTFRKFDTFLTCFIDLAITSFLNTLRDGLDIFFKFETFLFSCTMYGSTNER